MSIIVLKLHSSHYSADLQRISHHFVFAQVAQEVDKAVGAAEEVDEEEVGGARGVCGQAEGGGAAQEGGEHQAAEGGRQEGEGQEGGQEGARQGARIQVMSERVTYVICYSFSGN